MTEANQTSGNLYRIEVQQTVASYMRGKNQDEAIKNVFHKHYAAQMSFDIFKQIVSKVERVVT